MSIQKSEINLEDGNKNYYRLGSGMIETRGRRRMLEEITKRSKNEGTPPVIEVSGNMLKKCGECKTDQPDVYLFIVRKPRTQEIELPLCQSCSEDIYNKVGRGDVGWEIKTVKGTINEEI